MILVPAALVVLESLPSAADGRLDSTMLPVPEYQDGDGHRATEKALAGIYAHVLGLEHVTTC